MEMDSGEPAEKVQDDGYIQDSSTDPWLSPGPDILDDIYGDQQVLPRIGDEYQVEIPPLMMDLYGVKLLEETTDMESKLEVDLSIHLGLPIPIMWISNVVNCIKIESNEFSRQVTETHLVGSVGSIIPPANSMGCLKTSVGDPMEVDLQPPLEPHKSAIEDDFEVRDKHPVPGLLGKPWNGFEQECFLLGLYIFGKNLILVKRFMECKDMGNILSFYYGKFYGSDRHRRWSETRKIRSRRCIHGQRLFTGWRQQELLSRLWPHVSEQNGNTLAEVSKTFSEGKISLEQYVNALKITVGPKALVEAVGIGKGKYDLTGTMMEPAKMNPVVASRSEIPIGKACSSLTTADIIRFLTGDFRLSKARSNDLFWEAVWPRLLARGWHSEQPKNQGYVSKSSLVFLIPGVKKFSRRKLVKGNHYFDSVTDVLSKVASDPGLLELEAEAVNGVGGAKVENGWDQQTKLEKGSSQRHCYLRPRASTSNQELMKFTVVDTSMVCGEEPFNVRELRSLPVDNTATESPSSLSRESDSNSFEDQVDKLDCNGRPESLVAESADSKQENNTKCGLDGPNPDAIDDACSLPRHMPVGGSGFADSLDKKHTSKGNNFQFGVEQSGKPNYLAPVTKRRRLNACSKLDGIRSNCTATGVTVSKEATTCFGRHLCETNEINPKKDTVGNVMQHKVSTSSSGKASVDEISDSGQSEIKLSHEKTQYRTLIDLNLPHVPPDFETCGSLSEGVDSQDGSNGNEASVPFETNRQHIESDAIETSNNIAPGDQPVATRRQSTRNRPLTTRALEAMESGFFSTKRRIKGTKVLPDENPIPRPSRRRVRGAAVNSTANSRDSANADACNLNLKVEGTDEECSSNTNTDLSKSLFQVEQQEDHNLLTHLKAAYQPEILTGKDDISG